MNENQCFMSFLPKSQTPPKPIHFTNYPVDCAELSNSISIQKIYNPCFWILLTSILKSCLDFLLGGF
uniref:Uncharacterized protein n=1 Tax=Rhizophora mucronata TaxID=61149 RepID=A0A2P2P3F6_RHIMU